MKTFYLITPLYIDRARKDNEQTVAFVESVGAWLNQWTVANNYAPVLIEDLSEETVVVAKIVDRFVTNYQNALSHVKCLGDVRDHFILTYYLQPMVVGAVSSPSGQTKTGLMSKWSPVAETKNTDGIDLFNRGFSWQYADGEPLPNEYEFATVDADGSIYVWSSRPTCNSEGSWDIINYRVGGVTGSHPPIFIGMCYRYPAGHKEGDAIMFDRTD